MSVLNIPILNKTKNKKRVTDWITKRKTKEKNHWRRRWKRSYQQQVIHHLFLKHSPRLFATRTPHTGIITKNPLTGWIGKNVFLFFRTKRKEKKKKEATDLVGWLVERDVAQDSQRESIQGRPNQTSPPIAANRGYSTWCLACNRNKRPSAHKTTEIISQFCYHSRSIRECNCAIRPEQNASPTSKFVFDHVRVLFVFQFIFKTKTYLVCTAHFR